MRLGLAVGRAVEGHVPDDRVDPERAGQLQLVRAEVDPRVDDGRLVERAAVEVRVAAEPRDVARDGVGLEDRALRRLEHGHLAGRRELCCRLGVYVLDRDLHAGIFSRNERFEGPEVARVGHQRQSHVAATVANTRCAG